MNRLELISLLTFVCMSGSLLAADEGGGDVKEACVRVVPENSDIQAHSISKPGSYCVEQDFYQTTLYALSEGWRATVPIDNMLHMYSGDVVIDLQGHELRTNSSRVNGVSAYPDRYHPKPLDHIVIKNGTIDLRGGEGVSLISQDIFERGGARHQAVNRYKTTDYILENLTIKTSGEGVILVGKNNIVRHCRIEAGNGAVQIYGPGAQVIDNEIILHSAEPNPSKYGDKPPIALILHDAEGAVVTGNTITVKGKMKNAQAIMLSRSPDVLIENNKINGVTEPYVIDDEPVGMVKRAYEEDTLPIHTGAPSPVSSAKSKNNVVNPRTSWFGF